MNVLDATNALFAASPDEGVIENRTFAEIAVGDSASLTRQATQRDVDLLAIVSGDMNRFTATRIPRGNTPFTRRLRAGSTARR